MRKYERFYLLDEEGRPCGVVKYTGKDSLDSNHLPVYEVKAVTQVLRFDLPQDALSSPAAPFILYNEGTPFFVKRDRLSPPEPTARTIGAPFNLNVAAAVDKENHLLGFVVNSSGYDRDWIPYKLDGTRVHDGNFSKQEAAEMLR